MKISSNIEQYFDDEGRPLVNGRVSFYKHDSDTLADIFYMEGADYVQADNPVITSDDGRVPTVWFEAAVVDVKVEKCLPDGTYEQLDTFQVGFDYPKAANSTLAYGIEGLKNTDPAVGTVQVIGYHDDADAPARFYVWDANCNTPADGGIIVESDVGEEGRWLLVWDDELLPSSVYGIVPGSNEANIAAFVGYPDVVGSYNIKTPPMPRFMAGTYTSNTSFSSTKALYFDVGAKFLNADFVCTRAIIPENSSYVADFVFTGDNAVAHSSWFRTVNSWWHCDAHTLVFDPVTYFSVKNLSISADLASRVLVGDKRVPTSYVNGAYLQVRNCSILGKGIFSPAYDVLKFYGMSFNTDWFDSVAYSQYDFGTIAGGHRLECRTALNNRIEFENIAPPNVYYKAVLANGDTEFDGHGATYSIFTNNTQFAKISNCSVPAMADTACSEWKDVNVSGGLAFGNAGPSTVTMEGCSFYLSGDLPARIQTIQLDSCDVSSGGRWITSNTRIAVSNSNWNATCVLSDAAKSSRTLAKTLSFDRCVLSMGSNTIWTNNLTMAHCTSTAHIYLVPYSDNGTFRLVGTFIDNLFAQGALIELGPKDMSSETDLYGVVATLMFKDNRFNQEDTRGIVMPYVTTEFNWSKTYLAPGSSSVYTGNTGNCPKERPSQAFFAGNMTDSIAWGTDYLHFLPPAIYGERVWNLSNGETFNDNLLGIQFERSSDSWNPVNGRDADAHYGELLHVVRAAISDVNNDQFLAVHCWEGIDGWDSDLTVYYFG